MITLDHLRELRALLSDPARHTTGVYARDAEDRKIDPRAPDAVCWCLLGGVAKIGNEAAVTDALYAQLPDDFRLNTSLGVGDKTSDLADFNDNCPDQVLPLIDRAIAALEAAP